MSKATSPWSEVDNSGQGLKNDRVLFGRPKTILHYSPTLWRPVSLIGRRRQAPPLNCGGRILRA